MKLLIRENIPCWYELSFSKQTPGILLRLHNDFLAASEIPQSPPITDHYKEEFGFKNFGLNFQTDIGFEGALKFHGEKGDFHEYLIPLPKVLKQTNQRCGLCEGSGKDWAKDECFSCRGTDKQVVPDYTCAYVISATLSILTDFLCLLEKPTRSRLPQLLNLQVICQQGMHGGSLGGEYSIPLVQWLVAQGSHKKVPEMVSAMRTSWTYMMEDKDDLLKFRASIDYPNGWLNVDCPGDACGLHPMRDIYSNNGYEFTCHNVDTPAQQLTLIAGLAALHDRVRKETS